MAPGMDEVEGAGVSRVGGRALDEARRASTGAVWDPEDGWNDVPEGIAPRTFGKTAEQGYLADTPAVDEDAYRWGWERISAYYLTLDRARAAFVRGFLAAEERKRERQLSQREGTSGTRLAEHFFTVFLDPPERRS